MKVISPTVFYTTNFRNQNASVSFVARNLSNRIFLEFEDRTEMQKHIRKVCSLNRKITKPGSLYFTNSSLPKLMLSNMLKDYNFPKAFKRTNNPDADYIVSDFHATHRDFLGICFYGLLEDDILIADETSPISTDEIQPHIVKLLKAPYQPKYYICLNKKFYEQTYKYIEDERFISTFELWRYLSSHLSKPTAEQIEQLSSQIKSGDKEQNELVYKSLLLFDWSNNWVDFFNLAALSTNECGYNKAFEKSSIRKNTSNAFLFSLIHPGIREGRWHDKKNNYTYQLLVWNADSSKFSNYKSVCNILYFGLPSLKNNFQECQDFLKTLFEKFKYQFPVTLSSEYKKTTVADRCASGFFEMILSLSDMKSIAIDISKTVTTTLTVGNYMLW